MRRSQIAISIVIPTLNAGAEFEKSLAMIYQQKFSHRFEVIIIDSGSIDGTVEIAKIFPVRLHQIDRRDFNHGLTRQQGVELSRGDYVAFLTQDAIPYDEHWLSSLVETLENDENVAGVYSRQIPKAGCDPIAKIRIENWIAGRQEKKVSYIRSRLVYDSLSPWEKRKFLNYDDVSSCAKKSIMKKFPYSKVDFGEDLEWSKRVMEAGYRVIYEPRSKVYHSHPTSIVRNYQRAYVDHKTMKQLLGVDFYSQHFFSSKLSLFRSTWHQIKDDYRSIHNSDLGTLHKIWWLLYAIPMEFMEKVGMLRGAAAVNVQKNKREQRMKIVLVTHDFPPDHYGGVAVYIYNLAKKLSENHTVYVFYRKSDKKLQEYRVNTEIREGLSVTSINNNFVEKVNAQIAYQDSHVDKAFSKFLAETRPDIVHFQFLGAGLSAGMAAVAKRHKIPMVLTLHDYWFMCSRGQMMNYKWELCSEAVVKKCARCVFGTHEPLSALEKNQADDQFIDLLGVNGELIPKKVTIKTADPAYVQNCTFTVNALTKPALLGHPPSEVHYRVRLPRKSRLRFSVGMHPDTWVHKEGEGVQFEIQVGRDEQEAENVFSKYIDPKHKTADRIWHDYVVDLSAFGEKTVNLVFKTKPGPNKNIDYCSAAWGDLRIQAEEADGRPYGVIDPKEKVNLIRDRIVKAYDSFRKIEKAPKIFIRALHKVYLGILGNEIKINRIRRRNRDLLRTLKEIDLLIAPSNFLREKYLNFGVPEDKIVYSDNGMNTDIVKKSRRGASDKLIFGFTGTFMPTKGVHVLIDAFTRVPTDKAGLRLFGDAPNKFHDEYSQLTRDKSFMDSQR